MLLTPMARNGVEPIGSMGTDSPIAALSARPRLLFDYFSQLFAQVTNPPLDAIREELVTSLAGTIGPEGNLLDPGPASCRQVVLPFPVIDNDELAKIIHVNRDGDLPGYATHVVHGLYDVEGGGPALAAPDRRDLRRGVGRDRRRGPHHRAVGPPLDGGAGADPVAAAHRRRPPPPGAREDAHAGRARRRGRRRPRGPPRRPADRLRRRRGQPLPRDGDRRGPGTPAGAPDRRRARAGGAQPGEGARQGRAQGDEQDGRLHRRVVHRRPDLRGRRTQRRPSSTRTSPVRRRSSVASAWTCSPARSRRGTAGPTRSTASRRRTGDSTSVASTSGGARASRTCSTPTRCSGCSTRRGPAATTSSSSTRSWSTSRASG